jgi:hypothetical protein
MYVGLHGKYPLFLSEFNEISKFSRWIFEIYPNVKFNENPPPPQEEPSCSIRADGRTDRHDEAISRFSQSCERT